MLLIYETNKRKVVPYLRWYDVEKSYDLVLESPVQSGFLAQKNKTETETSPDVS